MIQTTLDALPVYQYPDYWSLEECGNFALSEVLCMEEKLYEQYMVSTELLNEGVKEVAAGVKAKVKNMVEKVWRFISGLVNKFLNFIDTYVAGNKKFIRTNAKYIEKGFNNYPAEGIDFGTMKSFTKNVAQDFFNIAKMNEVFQIMEGEKSVSTASRVPTGKNGREDVIKKFLSVTVGNGIEKLEDVEKAFYGDEVSGKISKSDFTSYFGSISEIMSSVSSAKNTISTVKKNYNSAKKYLDAIQKKSDKNDSGEVNTNLFSGLLSSITELYKVQIVALKDQLVTYKKLCTELATVGKKGDTDHKTEETPEGGKDAKDTGEKDNTKEKEDDAPKAGESRENTVAIVRDSLTRYLSNEKHTENGTKMGSAIFNDAKKYSGIDMIKYKDSDVFESDKDPKAPKLKYMDMSLKDLKSEKSKIQKALEKNFSKEKLLVLGDLTSTIVRKGGGTAKDTKGNGGKNNPQNEQQQYRRLYLGVLNSTIARAKTGEDPTTVLMSANKTFAKKYGDEAKKITFNSKAKKLSTKYFKGKNGNQIINDNGKDSLIENFTQRNLVTYIKSQMSQKK